MRYAEFIELTDDSKEEVCRQVYLENRDTIKIRKEKTVVKNFEKILDAVFEISYEKGFHAMSMRDLSKKAGLSMGALYPYFKSKEELLAIIQRQGESMIRGVLEKFDSEHHAPMERLEAVIRAHIFLSERSRPWFYFMFMEAKNLSPDERKTILETESYTEKVIVDILETGEASGVFRKQNHLLTASIIKAMQQEWYLKRWKYTNRKISADDYADHVLGFVRSFCLTEKSNTEGKK